MASVSSLLVTWHPLQYSTRLHRSSSLRRQGPGDLVLEKHTRSERGIPGTPALATHRSSSLRWQEPSDLVLEKHTRSERGIPGTPALATHRSSSLRRQGPSDLVLEKHAPSERGIHAFYARLHRASYFLLRGQREAGRSPWMASGKRQDVSTCSACSKGQRIVTGSLLSQGRRVV
jgi:hypothetical protein